ncbi:adenylosuccinate synthase [Chloroflexota bacterium]
MAIRIVVGVNWGDEGKGRCVDYFARSADYVIRYQGGNNAGHTVENNLGTFKLHLIPSGVFYPEVVNILGPGTVVNLEALDDEITGLQERGIDINPGNYKVSDRAVIAFPFHKLQDGYEEERLRENQFGSTGQGIGPAYSDRYLKYGIQVGAVLYPEFLKEQIIRCLDLKNTIFRNVYNKPPVDPEEVYNWAMDFGTRLKPYICDTVAFLKENHQPDTNVIIEGQLGALRDINYGIYPFTTSSSTIASYGQVGAGFFNWEKPEVTGVMKAFSTCVGEGPFTTEMKDELADSIREASYEYGVKTGRPRRIGWFDCVASKYGIEVNGVSELALTKLDSLSGLPKLKICTRYRIGSRATDDFPIMPELMQAEPEYIELPGWDEDITEVRRFDDLPLAARSYVEKIEELVDRDINYISVGPHREAMIIRLETK